MEEVSGDNYIIELSEKSQGFLDTTSVKLYASDSSIKLNKNDDIFIKFNNIHIHNKELNFVSVELYKYYETIEKNIKGHVTWFVPNDFGGILKYDGIEFEFNGNKYVDYGNDISEDGKQYFVDIYDGGLLFEEYKNMFPPMKWYNMVNPQETYFDIIVDIYKK